MYTVANLQRKWYIGEELINSSLHNTGKNTGKKKTQLIREALQDYFDIQAVTKTVQDYKMGTLKSVSHEDVRATLGL